MVPIQFFYQDTLQSVLNLLPPQCAGVSNTSKYEEMFNEALTLSLASESDEKEKYQIYCFQDIQAKLPLLSIPKTWSLWYPEDHSLIYMLPLLTEHNIIVNTHILVSFDLSVRAHRNGEILPLPICSISDIRHLESILCEISKSPRPVLFTLICFKDH